MPKPLPSLSSIHTIAFDFDGVFTDNKVWVDRDGREMVRCDRRDGLAFDIVRACTCRGWMRADILILSKETNGVVAARAEKLKLRYHQAVGDKLQFMREYLAHKWPDSSDSFAGLVYVGNDLNDLPLLRHAGYSVAPSDAHPLVREAVDLVLDEVGGDGFVRAAVEHLISLNQLSGETIDELVSDR